MMPVTHAHFFPPLLIFNFATLDSGPRCHSLCISVCRLQKESRLPPTTVARRPLRGDVMASGTLAPWLVMKTGDSLILRAPECPDETKHGREAKRVPKKRKTTKNSCCCCFWRTKVMEMRLIKNSPPPLSINARLPSRARYPRLNPSCPSPAKKNPALALHSAIHLSLPL